MAFAVSALSCHPPSSKCSWSEEMNDREGYSLGLVLTHASESGGGVEADRGGWRLTGAGEEIGC